MVPDDSTSDGGADFEGAPEVPPTLEQLADLQAGLLDDATAARLRRRIRDDPEVAGQFAALQRVRHELRDLAAAPAADPPPEVTAAISAALRGAGRRPHRRRTAAWVGAAALLVAVVVLIMLRIWVP